MTAPGPYIVTTKRQVVFCAEHEPFGHGKATMTESVLSRVEVATLDEAQATVRSEAGGLRDAGRIGPSAWGRLLRFGFNLSEQGGSINLPDGTVIEVSRADA